MIGVILAAGFATRLRSVVSGIPKTLIELEPDVTILDYVVGVFREVGVKDIYVVTRSELEQFFRGRGDVEVLVIDVAEGDGNLWTFYQALRVLKSRGVEDDIVLSMSDHIYEIAILRKLVKTVKGSSQIYLCLDRLIRGRDAVEGLKIVVDGNTVVLSGKNIPPYSGIDTGLFYIPRNIYSYIEKVVAEKGRKASLSDLINTLAREGLVSYIDVSGHLWQDIDTPEDVERARELYWKILAKNLVKESDGIVSRYINRKISTKISLALYKSRIYVDPNIVTLIVFSIGILASFFIFLGKNLVGAVLAILSSILDGVDGELARLFKAQSRFGAFLDTLLDRVVDTMIMAAMFYQLITKIIVSHAVDIIQLVLFTSLFSLTLLGSICVSYVSNIVEDREFIAKLRNSFPWATRDVRITVLAISTILNMYEVGFMYIAFSSWFFIVRALTYRMREEIRFRKKIMLPRIEVPMAKPVVKPSIGLIVEKMLLNLALLIVLVHLSSVALDKISFYQISEGSYLYTFLWQFISSIEIALIIYFAYNLLKNLVALFTALRDRVVEKLWVTPSVYQKIIKRAILIIIASLSIYPLKFVLALSNAEKDLVDLSNYTVTAIILILLVLLVVDIAKAFEHLVKDRVHRVKH
uniref:Bifunctional IPC transferase and DIPP synthase n=1 Tax=Ignisphaera aggregans TaxID=334771 RepID=A0A7J2U510_9CREN